MSYGWVVLKRKVREVIHVGDDVEISVNYIKGQVVSLAIKAPKGVPIDRGERRERLNKEAELDSKK